MVLVLKYCNIIRPYNFNRTKQKCKIDSLQDVQYENCFRSNRRTGNIDGQQQSDRRILFSANKLVRFCMNLRLFDYQVKRAVTRTTYIPNIALTSLRRFSRQGDTAFPYLDDRQNQNRMWGSNYRCGRKFH